MIPGPRSATPAPTAPTATAVPTLTRVTYTVTQVIMGMSQVAWNNQGGNQAYQNIVQGLLSGFSVTVTVSTQSFRRNLQSGGGSSNVLVTTTITGSTATRAQVVTALQATTPAGVSVIAQQLALNAGFGNIRAQAIVQPGVSPTNPPTRSPTGVSAALAAQGTQNTTTGGLPTATLVAIVVVLVLVVVAAAFVAFRNAQSTKGTKTIVVDPYGQYRNSGRSSGSFQSVSPVHRRPSFGTAQTHTAPRRHSRGDAIEMTDAYGYADGGGRHSVSEANPGFGSSRLSSGRASFGGGADGRRPSFGGDTRRSSIGAGGEGARRSSMGGEGRRSSFDGMAARQLPLPPGTRVTRL